MLLSKEPKNHGNIPAVKVNQLTPLYQFNEENNVKSIFSYIHGRTEYNLLRGYRREVFRATPI